MARRRQAHDGRPHRVDHHARSRRRPRRRCRTARSIGGRTRSPTSCRCSGANRNVAVDIADPLGNIGTFRMNHLHPPFNDVRARRAVLMALDQEEYMRALVGDDNSLWKPLPGYLHAGHAALQRGRRRDPQGQARHRRGKEAPRRERLHQPAGDLRRGAGPADHQGAGRRHGRAPEAHRHECRLRRDRLGHDRPAPGAEIAAGAGRLGDVPLLARRLGLHQPGGLHRDPRQRRRRLVRLAERARRSRRRSPPGSTPRTSRRRRPPPAGSTRPRSTTSSTRRPASSSPTRPGARTSPASARARCRSSGACRRRRDGRGARPRTRHSEARREAGASEDARRPTQRACRVRASEARHWLRASALRAR